MIDHLDAIDARMWQANTKLPGLVNKFRSAGFVVSGTTEGDLDCDPEIIPGRKFYIQVCGPQRLFLSEETGEGNDLVFTTHASGSAERTICALRALVSPA